MKYCVKCGNELHDEAVICPKCGCAVDNMYYNITKQKKSTTNSNVDSNELKEGGNSEKALSILNFIFSVLLILSFCFSLCAIASPHIRFTWWSKTISGNSVIYDISYAYNNDYVLSLLSVILASVSTAGFIVYFILFFVKAKDKNLNNIFKTILKVLLSFVVLSIAIITISYYFYAY